jgi:DNA-nicking Smr family endonuclease
MSKKRKKIKKDRHGFYLLTDHDDMADIWNTRRPCTDEDEDFANMFEHSLSDPDQQAYLSEKIREKEPHTPLCIDKKIKSYPPVQEELDLHRYTAARAETRVEAFIRLARARGTRTVRIIVGKGHHSAGKPVLPDVIETKLYALKREGKILAFKWERKDKRKSGAVAVYLPVP